LDGGKEGWKERRREGRKDGLINGWMDGRVDDFGLMKYFFDSPPPPFSSSSSGITVLGGPEPLLKFYKIFNETLLWVGVVAPRPTPNLQDQGNHFYLGHNL
jgi:hypothetical protein